MSFAKGFVFYFRQVLNIFYTTVFTSSLSLYS